MLLTRVSEYALLSLDAIRKSDLPIGAEQLATELCIPKSFLAKILQGLARQGILESRKGAHGGFILAREIDQISVRDIIIAAEGKAPAVFDCTSYAASCPNGSIGTCAISPFLMTFQSKIDDFLNGLMLSDIL
ncbi:MAG TPA: Rrf2 family transcriptional regulator [Sulfurovum sp.]|jgi:Rrf2 family protein|nr:MAG: transcriptional regulator [Sulfurovum sp. 35-42-20]OYY55860.1 MAG: transcriptional regulator [Sulfurovum sp. 28-43-6]OYZ25158.1 MAG: transcriptional regulator [Sulfurovum sp. 16-42-52]OYZ50172.1 MAG: transcriptional regulator [Sulfurovum sp. 24-42-9]OZA42931.1 MAG: transcriptional regulator [Sulfurovum sp. 17-42-90]OZA61008.1 MAG: transcriptional regulator [Sulfurovum sp. 39-42-12]HQR73054.1 Rrf2 family transcriptional regulator [Sulfurovum sp.]